MEQFHPRCLRDPNITAVIRCASVFPSLHCTTTQPRQSQMLISQSYAEPSPNPASDGAVLGVFI
jgi:hypothetical protein